VAWKELRFPLRGLDRERTEATLAELGALAVTLEDDADDPLLEPEPGEQPLWPACRVRGLFDAHQDLDAVIQKLNSPVQPEIVVIEDRQWETAWRDNFKPMRFGSNLWVCPSGEAAPQGATVVRLDPGLAFGTGTHPTTALCLEWLARLPLDGKQVIDYGCGSGILAIAAAKLGADCVQAVDYDPQALTATRDNAAANDVAGKIIASNPERFDTGTADLLVANILARPLAGLAETFARLVAPGGRIGLSGILPTQCDALTVTYSRWFTLNDAILRDGWVLLEGRRRC
jgi:ribosomal protein L11 methyltransferase